MALNLKLFKLILTFNLGNKTSNYMISLDINNPKPKGEMYLGKLRAVDKHKNEYHLFDSGQNPKE